MNIIFIITLWFLSNNGYIPQVLAILGTIFGSLNILWGLFVGGVKIGSIAKE